MPLTAETQLILQARADSPLAHLETLSPEQARAAFDAIAAAAPAPEPVERVQQGRVAANDVEIPIRAYWPNAAALLPALVFYHGGGWVIGNLDSHDALCRALANASGQCVISVDYRLAPEARYPAAVDDAYAAAAWVSEHAAELRIDPQRISVGGDSAGGNLAAAVCLLARERGEFAVHRQVLIYPVTDHDFDTDSYRANGGGEFGLGTAGMRWFWQHYLGEATARGSEPCASPLREPNLAGLPPAVVITAEYDPLRSEAEAYAERLRGAGVKTELHRHDGVIHGFVAQSALVPEGRQAIVQVADFLNA